MTHLAYAYGEPLASAVFKRRPEDFKVIEQLPFSPDGEGHHLLLEVEKKDINTLDLLQAISRDLAVPRKHIGYSGLKDRFALTSQWVSIPAQGLDIDRVRSLRGKAWRVLCAKHHRRKLRVGTHQANQFEITLRDVPPNDALQLKIEARLEGIRKDGVPNYFGPQRFGQGGSNLHKAISLFERGQSLPRQQHRFAVSAARSFLFNQVLSARVSQDQWNCFIPGDLVMLAGSRSWFELDRLGDEGAERLAAHDIHPSGPMWGAGVTSASGEAMDLEQKVIGQYSSLSQGLASLGLTQERRSLRLTVGELNWSWHAHVLKLSFVLGKGAFATSVLRELIDNDQLRHRVPTSLNRE